MAGGLKISISTCTVTQGVFEVAKYCSRKGSFLSSPQALMKYAKWSLRDKDIMGGVPPNWAYYLMVIVHFRVQPECTKIFFTYFTDWRLPILRTSFNQRRQYHQPSSVAGLPSTVIHNA